MSTDWPLWDESAELTLTVRWTQLLVAAVLHSVWGIESTVPEVLRIPTRRVSLQAVEVSWVPM